MNNIISKILLLALFAGGIGYYSYISATSVPCQRPLEYRIGEFDPRFNISQDEFKTALAEAESAWERELGRDFFNYNPEAKFAVNLIFDQRQEKTISEQQSRTQIDSKDRIYREKVFQYNAKLETQRLDTAAYDAAAAAYEQHLNEYNQRVSYWNEQGGAPAAEYQKLQRQKAALQAESRALERQRAELNALIAELNTMAAEVNRLGRELNLRVDAYNGEFGLAQEFDQGIYNGRAINIYQFTSLDDLRLVLAHELGHALGIEHVDEPTAVMHYLLDKQNMSQLTLVGADLAAARAACSLE